MNTGRALFLDRDGVINEVVFRNGQPTSPRTLEEFRFLEGITEPLRQCKAAGFRLFIVSNQPDVARGLLDPSVLEGMTQKIRENIPVEQVLICPHDDADRCDCRKPNPGLLLKIAEKEEIDLVRSFMVGDSWKDMQAGKSAQATTILLRRDYNKGVSADHIVDHIREAVALIVNGRKKS